MERISLKFLLFLMCIVSISVAVNSLQRIRLDNGVNQRRGGQYFIDEVGRVRLFHGTNFVQKTFPWYPTLNKTEIASLKALGFNAVRLGCMWAGIEPERGQYNMTYYAELKKLVAAFAEEGIYTLLDSHQDVWNRKFCGEGAPDWAAIASSDALPFPEPVHRNATPIDPVTGYPIICPLTYWWLNYFTAAASSAFQNVYDNYDNLQDSFASQWQITASQFANENAILGYELMNEPWMGDIYTNPDLLLPDVADRTNLQPLYQNLNKAIRSADEDHIIFFEPVTWDYWPVGFTEPPGGEVYANRSVLSYHIYCLGYDDGGYMGNKLWKACNFTAFEMMDFRKLDQERLNVGGFMTEWGDIHSQDENAMDLLVYIADKADSLIQSWTYWAGLIDNPTKVWALSRTYPQAIAGNPKSIQFDNSTSEFVLKFEPNVAISAPTVIYFNQLVRYASGFEVTVSPSDALEWSVDANDSNILNFTYSPSFISTASRLFTSELLLGDITITITAS